MCVYQKLCDKFCLNFLAKWNALEGPFTDSQYNVGASVANIDCQQSFTGLYAVNTVMHVYLRSLPRVGDRAEHACLSLYLLAKGPPGIRSLSLGFENESMDSPSGLS